MIYCLFEQLRPALVHCVRCGRMVETPHPPGRVYARCRSAPGYRMRPQKPKVLPGTELKKLIYEHGGPPPCQRCIEVAARMDAWGPDECQKRRAEIVAALNENFAQLDGLNKIRAARAAASAIAAGAPISDVAGWFIDKAIRRSREQGLGARDQGAEKMNP